MADLRFKLIEPDTIEFKPGQFVQVRIPDPDSPDGTAFRAYSIASKPSDSHAVELVVRLVPGDKGSTYLHNVKEGEEVEFTGPYGEFEFIDDADYHFMMVGGGAGMAPMKSLIQHILEITPEREMELYFGCRDTPDIFYKDWYEELSKKHPNFKVMFALSDLNEETKAEKDWDGATGFIHLHVDKNYNPPEKRQVFLCGPPPMIDAVMKVLFENKGLKEEEVFYDKF
jgi:Na+-transporting NADH:ubiquinone oxidoreductase subunit F